MERKDNIALMAEAIEAENEQATVSTSKPEDDRELDIDEDSAKEIAESAEISETVVEDLGLEEEVTR